MFPIKKQEDRSAGRRDETRKNRDSFLETIESFVIAFILAFVFRAYVVEAFVIPTGSMAPRLNGEHYEFECSRCGYEYNVGLDQAARGNPEVDAVCPLCYNREKLTREDIDRLDRFFGDRILVLKYFYDFFPPQRWDVVVFKYPYDPKTNYIKRLVGLPGEQIEILRGDVYINGAIARKSDAAQQALWMHVSDSDYWDTRRGLHWKPEQLDDPQWQYTTLPLTFNPQTSAPSYLVFHHLGLDGKPAPIRDFYAYDDPTGPTGRSDNQNIVPDFQLRADLEVATPEQDMPGPALVEVVLGSFADTFRFAIPVAQSGLPVRIVHNNEVLASVLTPAPLLTYGKRFFIEAACVDHKLMLTIDDRRALDVNNDGLLNTADDPIFKPTPRDRWSEPPENATRVKLGFQNVKATVYRLAVNRDIYYTAGDGGLQPVRGVRGWALLEPCPLGQKEYFMLGDNSPRSADSRWWQTKTPPYKSSPVVREENLVGKAFFVYWPAAGLRYRVPYLRALPDVKEFRLIK